MPDTQTVANVCLDKSTEWGEEFCSNWIAGMVDGMLHGMATGMLQLAPNELSQNSTTNISKRMGFCLPDYVDTQQVVNVFRKYVAQHPEEFSEPVAFVLENALIRAFPCN
jgi:hypothetical protein